MTTAPDPTEGLARTPAAKDTTEPSQYYVVFFTTKFASLAQAQQQEPTLMAEHMSRTRQLHAQGDVLMAGAFLDNPDEPVRTMVVLPSRQAAEDYAHGDPFLIADLISEWTIREWNNMLA